MTCPGIAAGAGIQTRRPGRESDPARLGRDGVAEDIVVLDGVGMRYPVAKRYRDYLRLPFKRRYFSALHDVSLTIRKGECVGMLGSNGAGKTTLLKLIGGLLYPFTGTVSVDGRDARTENQKVREKVGFVMNEERSFYWRLTGGQNLEFFGALNNLWGRQRRRRIERLLRLAGLWDVRDVRVSNYSCGMRQRLAIARGLLADPDVLILDEPTKSLDPIGAEELRRLISGEIRSRRKKTLIVATHQIQEAETLCDRVCILVKGRLVACSPVPEILDRSGGLAGYYKASVARAGSS